MSTDNLAKLESVLTDLRKRVDSNRPMNTEELVATLLVVAESIHELLTRDRIKVKTGE
jgi:hypothetical protein